MLGDLQCACDNRRCGRTLDETELFIRMQTDAGERRAYRCPCGAVTVKVIR